MTRLRRPASMSSTSDALVTAAFCRSGDDHTPLIREEPYCRAGTTTKGLDADAPFGCSLSSSCNRAPVESPRVQSDA